MERFDSWSRSSLHNLTILVYRNASYISITFIFWEIVGYGSIFNRTFSWILEATLSLFPLLRGLVRYDINWKVFDEFRKVTHNVSHSYVERFLNLLPPGCVNDLITWKEILQLGHLFEVILFDHIWVHAQLRQLKARRAHEACLVLIIVLLICRKDRVLVLGGLICADIQRGVLQIIAPSMLLTYLLPTSNLIQTVGWFGSRLLLLHHLWWTLQSWVLILLLDLWWKDRSNFAKRIQILVLPLVDTHVQLFPFLFQSLVG